MNKKCRRKITKDFLNTLARRNVSDLDLRVSDSHGFPACDVRGAASFTTIPRTAASMLITFFLFDLTAFGGGVIGTTKSPPPRGRAVGHRPLAAVCTAGRPPTPCPSEYVFSLRMALAIGIPRPCIRGYRSSSENNGSES